MRMQFPDCQRPQRILTLAASAAHAASAPAVLEVLAALAVRGFTADLFSAAQISVRGLFVQFDFCVQRGRSVFQPPQKYHRQLPCRSALAKYIVQLLDGRCLQRSLSLTASASRAASRAQCSQCSRLFHIAVLQWTCSRPLCFRLKLLEFSLYSFICACGNNK